MVPDFALWKQVSKTIKPLDPQSASQLEQIPNGSVPFVVTKSAENSSMPSTKSAFEQSHITPHLEFTGLDRRQQQRFLRGRVEIDARIDLHGENLETARVKLWRFLADCMDQGHRTVLVITGKGTAQFTRHTLHGRDLYESLPRTGKLRNALPDWLHETEFRMLVSGFQPAHPKHGGGGAVYLRLRNRNKRGRFP